MILVAVLDGLRPDMVTPERMPYLSAMASRGTWCTASHSVFPTATRINSASLSTGCYPERHGLVGNELYSRAVDPYAALSCADWRALQSLADAEGGRLLTVPTLAELLRDAGRRIVCAGSGSPGTTYLLNPTATAPVVNWATAWPPTVAERVGGFLDEASDSLERTDFVLRVLYEELISQERPDVVVLWVTEPDHAQHAHGLGAPESLAALREVDRRLEELIAHLGDAYGAEPDVLVTSDHGFSTITERIPLGEEMDGLREIPGLEGLGAGDAVFAGSGLYLHGAALERLPEIVGRLGTRPWLGALAVRDDHLSCCPDALPVSALRCMHGRSPHVVVSGSWDDGTNGHGVPGRARSSSRNVATHGSAGPYDVHNVLAAWGPSFRDGAVSELPCAVVDIAPTVLHLLGIAPPVGMDGRVLHEVLADGPRGDPPVTTSRRDAPLGPGRRQVLHYRAVGTHRYLDHVSVERV